LDFYPETHYVAEVIGMGKKTLGSSQKGFDDERLKRFCRDSPLIVVARRHLPVRVCFPNCRTEEYVVSMPVERSPAME
jgi:hypothetical protein